MKKLSLFLLPIIAIVVMFGCKKKVVVDESNQLENSVVDTTLVDSLTWQEEIALEIFEAKQEMPIQIDDQTWLVDYNLDSLNNITYTYQVDIEESADNLSLTKQQIDKMRQIHINDITADNGDDLTMQMAVDDVHVIFLYLNRFGKEIVRFDIPLKDYITIK